MRRAMQGMDAVVHLAAASQTNDPWPDVLRLNIEAMHALLNAARSARVERVIFASTNHVVGMVEEDHKPRIYYPGHGILIDETHPPRPDSYYGASKLFGEGLGRWFAESGGPKFYALRIGAVVPAAHDHPYYYAENAMRREKFPRDSEKYRNFVGRLKGLWLSHGDCRQIFQRVLDYKGPAFDVFNAVSDNDSRWLSIQKARDRLGYTPEDNGDAWTSKPGGSLPHQPTA